MPIGACSYRRSILPDSHWEALYTANEILLDGLISDLQEIKRNAAADDLYIVDFLPRKQINRYNEEFLRKFLVCLASVGLKMRLADWHMLGCVAEELALYATIQLAEILLEEKGIDADFDDLYELAFEDEDYRFLYSEAMDGLGDLNSETGLAIAHLRFGEWFIPFNPPRITHPYADHGKQPPWESDRKHYADDSDDVEDEDEDE